MIPATPASPVMLDFFCTEKDLFSTLRRISSGDTLPANVTSDIDPHQYYPWNLPEDTWFYVRCDGNKDSVFGHWKPKGEDCKLYSSSSFYGWRTTFEFYSGEASHEQKTAWIMQKYWLTPKESPENSKKMVARSLCKVFVGDDHFTIMANGSTSRSHISEDDKMVELGVAGKPLDNHTESISEWDYLYRGDFLELLDLDIPASPSSSSDNSSSLTMKSDEYFDPDALLQEINRDSVQRDAAYKFSSSTSSRVKTTVLQEEASEAIVSNEANLKIDGAPRNGHAEQDSKLSSKSSGSGNSFEGPPPGSRTEMAVSNDQENVKNKGKADRKTAMNEGKEMKKKKIPNKYFCFFPF